MSGLPPIFALPYCITIILVQCFFFAPPAPFVGFKIWTCHYVTDKELINLLAPFAPGWMFAMSSLNPQHLFPTRTLPRSHVHFWNPTMDLTSWLGSPNWLWKVLLVCASVFHILLSGCNKEFIYLIYLIITSSALIENSMHTLISSKYLEAINMC